MYAIYRVRQMRTTELIIHRRKGCSRIRSIYDRKYGHKGKWRTVCNCWTTDGVNTTTKTTEVTCMRCLRRMV